jgi:hypothetical protein
MTSRRDFLIVAILAASLTGCGEDPEPATSGAAAPTAAAKPAARANDVEEATRGMVSGVAPGRAADAAVDLKFDLKSRPEVGKPLTIDIALLPKIASEVMNVTYLANEGLTVQTSTLPSKYEHVQSGSVYRHQAIVVPKDEGVFSLSAIVMVQTDSGDVTRTFSIPVVVGAPPDTERSAQP